MHQVTEGEYNVSLIIRKKLFTIAHKSIGWKILMSTD